MPPVSADNPLYFITAVTHKRLPVFRRDTMKQILAMAFDEARRSGAFKILAYVIMPEHYHLITDSNRKASDVVRYLNGISARRVIGHLKEEQFEASLNKLRKNEPGRKDYRYSLWEHHSNIFLITTESMLMKKVNYIHLNPVEDGLVEDDYQYAYSSVRFWNRKPLLETEPLDPDIKDLTWKTGGRASY
jgi:putative transposase